jgi:hypothetical protein
MANDFSYIEKTLPRRVDKVFAKNSVTEMLLGSEELQLDFLDAKTVKVFKLASTGLFGYKRGGHGYTNSRGSAQSTTETFTLSQERYSEIPLDKLDTLDDGETVLGHLADEFIRTKVVPEFDTYRLSKLAGYTNETFGNRVVKSEASLTNAILAEFTKAFEWMAEMKVPEKDQILYVNPKIMAKIRTSSELIRYLSQSDYKADVNFTIERFMGREIVEVPSDEFITDAVMGEGVYGPSASSKVINFMVVDKTSTIVIKKLDFAKVYDSSNGGAYLGYVGYMLSNLYYHDIFVPENRIAGIYACVSETSASGIGAALKVVAEASSESGKTVVKLVSTNPGGIMWDKLHLVTTGTAPVIGADISGGEISVGVAFTPNASHNHIAASLGGKVVAVSVDFEDDLPVGA